MESLSVAIPESRKHQLKRGTLVKPGNRSPPDYLAESKPKERKPNKRVQRKVDAGEDEQQLWKQIEAAPMRSRSQERARTRQSYYSRTITPADQLSYSSGPSGEHLPPPPRPTLITFSRGRDPAAGDMFEILPRDNPFLVPVMEAQTDEDVRRAREETQRRRGDEKRDVRNRRRGRVED